MARRFLRRLLGTGEPLAVGLADAISKIDGLSRSRPSLAAPAAVLREILPEVTTELEETARISPSSKDVTAKLARGTPLLRGESLTVDTASLRRRWLTVCRAVKRHQGGEVPTAIIKAADHGTLDPAELLAEVVAGRPAAVLERAQALGVDASLLATALRLAALPHMARLAIDFERLWRRAGWPHGYCPVCGSWPLLGEFRGLEQTQFLRCALCATSWEFPRLCCPFCGTSDHRQLAYIHAGGEQDRYRAATCDACHGYLKTVSTLAALSLPLLLVEDLATLHLDFAAADRGFFVP